MAKIKANQLDVTIAIQSVITDATFITNLKDVSNWDGTGEYTGTIPNDIGEGDYIYAEDTNGESWKYQYSQGVMFRIPHKLFEGVLITPPSLGGVSWIPWETSTGLNYWTGTVANVKRGSMWTDSNLGYVYIAFSDNTVTRMGGLNATGIIEAIDNSYGNTSWRTQLGGSEVVNLINSELGNTNWQLAGGGSGTAVLITDATLISDLQDNANWDNSGDFTGTVPGGLAEGAYYYGVSSDNENWLYQYSNSVFYRVPSKVFNAFITALDVSSVTWTQVSEDFATGALNGVFQGQLWQDTSEGYVYMSFADDTITRYGGLTATKIIASIDSAIGTTWKTGGSGGGTGNLITDLTFIAALQNDSNWTNDITYTGTIASGTAEGDYLISQSSTGDQYMYVYSDSTMYRIQFYIPNAFITAPDVSSVTWNVNGVYAYGTLAGSKQGDIFKDDTAGYVYICFTDGTITRIGGGSGTSETGATIEAKLDAYLSDPEWKVNHSSIITDATFITALTTESNWDSSETYNGGAIPAGVDEGDYLYGSSTSGAAYVYKNINGVMRRWPATLENAFVTAPDVSSVTWTDVGDFSYGNLTNIEQGELWSDTTNGYVYMCFTDGVITRLAFTSGGSMTNAQVVAAIDTELGNTDWKTQKAAATIVTDIDAQLGSTDWQSGGGAGGSGLDSSTGIPAFYTDAVGTGGTVSSFFANAAADGGVLIATGEQVPFFAVAELEAGTIKRKITGDFTFDVKLDAMVDDTTDASATDNWAGIAFMTGGGDDPFVTCLIRQENGSTWLTRKSYKTSVGGAIAQNDDAGTSGTYPGTYYLRITRTGNSISVFTSPDNTTFTEIDSATVNANFLGNGYIALVATNGANTNACRATFSAISVS